MRGGCGLIRGGLPLLRAQFDVFAAVRRPDARRAAPLFFVTLIATGAAPTINGVFLTVAALFAALTALGVHDLVQTRHAILRNYPIFAHLRFVLEEIRPEMRQYFFESETDGLPFSRTERAAVYQRAKRVIDKRPFGTLLDTNAPGHEWVRHSMTPKPVSEEGFRIVVGGPECLKPYSMSVLNVSAMSFGALSANAIVALNKGAALGGFAQDTGEGGVSPYHRQGGGDIVWEIGSGYFGCRTRDGRFDPEKFVAVAADDQIKMVEIKLSQGAKPGHGGVLPGPKVTEEIASIRGVEAGKDCVSPAATAPSRPRSNSSASLRRCATFPAASRWASSSASATLGSSSASARR